MIKHIAITLHSVVAFEGLNEDQVNELIGDSKFVLRVHADGTVEEYDEYDGWVALESHRYYLT